MVYREFKDETKISSLGLGTLHLPTELRNSDRIDVHACVELIKQALDSGINYFDTGYYYMHGYAEEILGNILTSLDTYRLNYYLATKMPINEEIEINNIDTIFNVQLKRLKTLYIDFYLLHNVCNMNIDLCIKHKDKILGYLLQQKELGRIKYIGFSTHAKLSLINKFLDEYGNHIDFCYLQVNPIDWEGQDANIKLDYLSKRNIPVFIMEPLKGGYLVKDKHLAFTFLNRLMERYPIISVLSGMSSMDQVIDNIECFNNPITGSIDDDIKHLIENWPTYRFCTDCNYCKERCILNIDIPELMEMHKRIFHNKENINISHKILCTQCGRCNTACPQNIPISNRILELIKKFNINPS